MSRTIVQEYGPIYGEAVNGTVLGRPNGSIYVPQGNNVKLTLPVDYRFISTFGDGYYRITASDGVQLTDEMPMNAVANSQDLASSILIVLSTSISFGADVIGGTSAVAGLFNVNYNSFGAVQSPPHQSSLYARAQLMSADWQIIAFSDYIEVEWLE